MNGWCFRILTATQTHKQLEEKHWIINAVCNYKIVFHTISFKNKFILTIIRKIISFTNIVFILSMTLAIGYFLTRRSHAIICCYNESSSMYCLRDDGTRNNSKSSWWGKTKMSIALRKLFSSLMLQLLLQFKEVQINEATFS